MIARGDGSKDAGCCAALYMIIQYLFAVTNSLSLIIHLIKVRICMLVFMSPLNVIKYML